MVEQTKQAKYYIESRDGITYEESNDRGKLERRLSAYPPGARVVDRPSAARTAPAILPSAPPGRQTRVRGRPAQRPAA